MVVTGNPAKCRRAPDAKIEPRWPPRPPFRQPKRRSTTAKPNASTAPISRQTHTRNNRPKTQPSRSHLVVPTASSPPIPGSRPPTPRLLFVLPLVAAPARQPAAEWLPTRTRSHPGPRVLVGAARCQICPFRCWRLPCHRPLGNPTHEARRHAAGTLAAPEGCDPLFGSGPTPWVGCHRDAIVYLRGGRCC